MDCNAKTSIGPINEEDLNAVLKSLKGKESIRGSKLQIEFKKGYNWAFKVLDCLEKNSIVSEPDKYGERKIIVDDDYFDSDFIFLEIDDLF